MRIRSTLLVALGAIAAAIALSCSGGHGGGGGGGTTTPTPSGCDSQWRIDDPGYAADMLADFSPGGAVTVSNGAVVMTFSGTLPASAGTDGRYATAALFSKRALLRNFDAFVRFDELSITGTNLAVFFAVQSSPQGNPHGLRYWVEEVPGGETMVDSEWYGGIPPADHGGGSPTVATVGDFDFARIDSITTQIAGSAGNQRSTRTNFDPGEPDTTVLGLGIANREPFPASGSVTVRFHGLAVVDTALNCFAGGLN